MKAGFLAFCAALLLLSTGGSAQFGTRTELVSIYTTVHDGTMRLVPDLTKDDFIVTDNGKVQEITYFSNEITPFSVIVMLDRSRSMFQHRAEIGKAAAAFVQKLLPNDKARIGSFGDYAGNRVVIRPSVFSSSQAELIEALQTPGTMGDRSPLLISIDQSLNSLLAQNGRRVVLVFSDGYDEPAKSLVPVGDKELLARVREAEIMVYSIGFTRVEQRTGKAPDVTPPHERLKMLAEDSGGGYFVVTDPAELTGLFTQVAEELHRQYWIGFVPQLRDGKVHTLKVTTKKPGLTVRAKQSYLAPK